MVAVIGLVMFIVSAVLALSKKMHLMVPFIVVPVIAGLLCGYSFNDIMGFAATGARLIRCCSVSSQCFISASCRKRECLTSS